jgi:hypothetical protein
VSSVQLANGQELIKQNEHAAEIRAMRDRDVSNGKATGTIFVKGEYVVRWDDLS